MTDLAVTMITLGKLGTEQTIMALTLDETASDKVLSYTHTFDNIQNVIGLCRRMGGAYDPPMATTGNMVRHLPRLPIRVGRNRYIALLTSAGLDFPEVRL